MAAELYNVVFQGEIAAGYSQDDVKNTLAATFKLQPQQLDKFFTGRPVLIQQQVDQQTALRYQNAFTKAGAVCSIVPVESQATAQQENVTPENPNQGYHLVFRGELLPGKQIEVVKQILSTKFKLSSRQLDAYFSGKPCQLTKAPVDKATAMKYRSAFEKAGAQCHLVPIRLESSQHPATHEGDTVPRKEAPMPQKPQTTDQLPPELPPEIPISQSPKAAPKQTPHIVPPPLPDVLPPMPKMPRQHQQISPPLSPRRAPKKKSSNFWVLVIVIPLALVLFMGIIAAIAVPNLLTAIQRSKVARTKADMRAIGTALGSFQVDNNTFPVEEDWVVLSDETLPGKYYAGTYQDAWGNWFFYASDGKNYHLVSYGKDMREGQTSSIFDKDIVYANGQFME